MSTELTPTQKAEIQDLAWRGYSARQIAPMVGVSVSTAGKYAKGYLRPPSGLTRAQVGHMRELRKLGRTIDYIAARIGCHPSTVFRHCRDIPIHRLGMTAQPVVTEAQIHRVERVTARELRAAEARYQRAFRAAETEREARNAAVRSALASGMTQRQVAAILGLRHLP